MPYEGDGTASSSSANGSTGADGRALPSYYTPELQKLYNKMQQLKENLSLEELLQIQEGQNGHNYHLLPPTPDATSMSRSTSRASSISLSVPHGASSHDGSDSQHHDDHKRRLGRRGPLSDFAKARTAFMRKLGACKTCHDRKVRVSKAQPFHQGLKAPALEISRSFKFGQLRLTQL
jgi:hypothetical protein